MDQSEHGHAQYNNGGETDPRTKQSTVINKNKEYNEGETDLQTNQNTVIDTWTVKTRPTYESIRARPSTIEQWMRDRPTDQKQNAVIDMTTTKARPT